MSMYIDHRIIVIMFIYGLISVAKSPCEQYMSLYHVKQFVTLWENVINHLHSRETIYQRTLRQVTSLMSMNSSLILVGKTSTV